MYHSQDRLRPTFVVDGYVAGFPGAPYLFPIDQAEVWYNRIRMRREGSYKLCTASTDVSSVVQRNDNFEAQAISC